MEKKENDLMRELEKFDDEDLDMDTPDPDDFFGEDEDDEIEDLDDLAEDEVEEEAGEKEKDDLLVVDLGEDASLLPEKVYKARVSDVTAKKTEGYYGSYTQVRIYFSIDTPKEYEGRIVSFIGAKSSNPGSRFRLFLNGMVGKEAAGKLDLSKLIGEWVHITVTHREDENGKIWENVTKAVRIKRDPL